MGDNPDGMATIARQCGLIDIIYHLHGPQPKFRTYDKGRTVIDYLFVTEDVVPTVNAAGYMPFNHRVHSDHRGFYLDIDTAKLFGSIAARLPPPCKREI